MWRGEDKIQNMKLKFDLTNLSQVLVLKLVPPYYNKSISSIGLSYFIQSFKPKNASQTDHMLTSKATASTNQSQRNNQNGISGAQTLDYKVIFFLCSINKIASALRPRLTSIRRLA